ncbi:ABC transporter substrate-binding protein [Desulfobacula sp.]|uniref:ABC transporter substrate-binding protein n=1 Tax=Desulfobacula sp. TaxID=2593537 RepID=UPI0026134CC1|nr:ABC transporter substrate-binding protein [Desulfobacula sp.]
MVKRIKKNDGKKRIKLVWLLVVLFSLAAGSVSAETLRMGILPVIDTLPLQVGVTEGYFKAENLDVKLVPFSSAMERNTAMHSGQLDGFFGDMPATLLLVRNNIPVRFLTISYATDKRQRMFGLMVSPELPAAREQGKLTVAISKASIIEYLLDHIKQLPETQMMQLEAVEIKRMPLRLQMLLTGKIDAALLPEPLVSLAENRGARLVVTDQPMDMPLTVLNIHTDKRHLAESFMKAYTQSVNALNQRPEKYRLLMTKTCRIPGNLVDTFPMYQYPAPRIPTQAEVQQVQDWMMKKGLLHQPIPYQRLIP